jgi:hypothetical protein
MGFYRTRCGQWLRSEKKMNSTFCFFAALKFDSKTSRSLKLHNGIGLSLTFLNSLVLTIHVQIPTPKETHSCCAKSQRIDKLFWCHQKAATCVNVTHVYRCSKWIYFLVTSIVFVNSSYGYRLNLYNESVGILIHYKWDWVSFSQ